MFMLFIILVMVLFLPFTKMIEHNLEVFLLIMGILSVWVTQQFDMLLVQEALVQPIKITCAVLFAGILFKWFQASIERGVLAVSQALPHRLFIALFVIVLGLLSSIITAIIAAIVLVAVLSVIKLDPVSERRVAILACYAIGLGAALTPIGEPLSTIITSKLDVEFSYLFKLLGPYVIPAIIIFGLLAAIGIRPKTYRDHLDLAQSDSPDTYLEIIVRSLKVYVFVMALTFLGTGFEPFIARYFLNMDPLMLYWINIISAVLDNATLAAAEVSSAMQTFTIKAILMGLLISGGMLIPGNIPNIIASGKLSISSLEYARIAFPIGLVMMVAYFALFLVFGS